MISNSYQTENREAPKDIYAYNLEARRQTPIPLPYLFIGLSGVGQVPIATVIASDTI